MGHILETSQFVLGEEVAQFEREFAEYSGASCGVAVNSGTSALHLALLAAQVGPGDEVITVPHTFVATVAAIRYTGARAVYVDIDTARYTMDPQRLEAAITPRTKAIIPVHLYGQPADMEPLLAPTRERELWVIEDASQAHGARYHGRRAGSLGHVAAFSLYPGKNLGAYGDAGVVTTNSAVCPKCGRESRLFGSGGGARTAEAHKVPYLGGIPLVRGVREASDSGCPITAADPGGEVGRAFVEIARRIVVELPVTAQHEAGHA